MVMTLRYSVAYGIAAGAAINSSSCEVDQGSRSDCGFMGVDQAGCESKGCCWMPVNPNPGNTPWCFSKGTAPTPSPTPAPTPTPTPTPSPTPGGDPSNPKPGRDTFVHLFEWSWSDVAQECEQWLGPKGFTAVQVSPPNEHISGSPWWTRYQPVTYELTSRSGNEAGFKDMINRCKAVGVGIYADAVVNHIAAGSGTSIAGKSYGNRATPIYSQNDLHHNNGDTSKNCQISNYADKNNVQSCDLSGLPDLCTGCDYVQKTIAAYLNHMGSLGIAGFRVDASKHMDAGELGSLLSKVDTKLWRFHEVISGSGEVVTPSMYTSIGEVTEFQYFRSLIPNIKDENKLSFLNNFGESWGLLPSGSAVVFIDNHDTQRGEAPLTYKDGDLYVLANIFMLAHPYGYPKIMSSYYFSGHDQGPPTSAIHSGGNVACGNGQPWVCEHRWTPLANMVNWRRSAGTAGVEQFSAPSGNTIAFCRGGAACVALNRGSGTWSATVTFSVPAGSYCNVIQSDDPASCPRIEVAADGHATFQVAPRGAVAVHVGKRAATVAVVV